MPKGKDVGADSMHHSCDLVFRYQKKEDGIIAYFCPTHNQYTYVYPIGKTWHYANHPDLKVMDGE